MAHHDIAHHDMDQCNVNPTISTFTSSIVDSRLEIEKLELRLKYARERLADTERYLSGYKTEQLMAHVLRAQSLEYVEHNKLGVVVGQVTEESNFRVTINNPLSQLSHLSFISFRCRTGNCSYPYAIELFDKNDKMYEDEKGFMDVSELLAAFAELLK